MDDITEENKGLEPAALMEVMENHISSLVCLQTIVNELGMIKKYRQVLDVIAEKQAQNEEERGTETALRRIFTEIDLDGDGTLSKAEMMVALKHMGACVIREYNTCTSA